jgi:hypothetical protein
VSDDYLNQQQTAERLGLRSRQVCNLRRDHGMPAVARKGRLFYHWPTIWRWYLDFKIEEALKRNSSCAGDAASSSRGKHSSGC